MRTLLVFVCPVLVAAVSIGACAEGDLIELPPNDAGVAPDRKVTPIRDTGAADTAVGPLDAATDTGTNPRPDAGVDSGRVDSGTDSGTDSGVADAAADSGSSDAGADSSMADASSDAAVGAGCDSLRINEVQVAGPGGATDEFVELYNTSATVTVSTANCRLAYRSKAGVADVNCVSTVHSIAPGGFAVFASAGFPGAKTGALGCAMAGTAGQLGLFVPGVGGALIDSMAYATVGDPITAVPNFIRGVKGPVLTPAANSSVGRMPDGRDTQITFDDFKLFAAPTPGAANL
jgi:hypothetical protein